MPTELHTQIFLDLRFSDLNSFRATSTQARSLLHSGEIIRQWILKHGNQQQLKLYPPPEDLTFQYILNQKYRTATAENLAQSLAEYIVREILRYTLRRLDVFPNRTRGEVFLTVKAQLKEKMIPLILTIQHYLTHSASILLSTVAKFGDEYHVHYRRLERAVVEGYALEELELTHKFWLFLVWLSDQLLNRPSYAGTLERTLRGWSMEALNRAEYRRFLVLGNVEGLFQLMMATSPKQRRKGIEGLMVKLDPGRNVNWQSHWEEVASMYDGQVTKEVVERVLQVQVSETDVFVESARSILKDKGSRVGSGDNSIGTPWQVMDFLCDLVGYDVLHLPPTM